MNKVLMFYGSRVEFEKNIPIDNVRNLTDVVMETDSDTRIFTVVVPDKDKPVKEKIYIQNFVIGSSEYAGVREHVILKFANFISKLNIDNLYLHNPPLQISNQLSRLFSNIEIKKQEYKAFSIENISPFFSMFD